MIFEINLVDLRTDPLKKEGMLAEPSATHNHIIRRMEI